MSKSKKPKKEPQEERGNSARPNIWGMFQNMFYYSTNRGQILVLVGGALIFTILVRMPREDISKLALKIVNELGVIHLLGWALSVLLAFLWFMFSRRGRKRYNKELNRILHEKEELHKILISQTK